MMGASEENASPGVTGSHGKGLSPAEQRADALCWSIFTSVSLLCLGLTAILVWTLWEIPDASNGRPRVSSHSMEYFILCMIGGVLSGLPHTAITPLDMMKCRVQCGEFASVGDGFAAVYREGQTSGASLLGRIDLFYRGWVPTLVGYSMQGALKFGLYEYFKHFFAQLVGREVVSHHRVALFLVSSATAELFADIALAPWEAVKIKMQTTRLYPPHVNVVVPRMFAVEGLNAFFKGLGPLWARQVPYTMVKFATFEKFVEFFYTRIFDKRTLPASGQLFVSLASGFCSGMICAVVSHPADTMVSKLNQRSDGGRSLAAIIRELGCRGLWNGLVARLIMIGTLTSLQWLIYDSFKVMIGMPTTGAGGASSNSTGRHR